jgi:hypothetical protein
LNKPTANRVNPFQESLERHQEWVSNNVSKDRLHFVDIKDGWAPLAAVAKCECPSTPFPRVNDMDGAEKIFKYMVVTSLKVWGAYLVAIGVACVAVWVWTH